VTRRRALVLGILLELMSCSEAGPIAPSTSVVRAHLVEVAALDQPVAMAVRGGDDALYFAERTGKVRAIRGGGVDPAPVLDLSAQISLGSEQGLLGLAFSEDGRYLYVNFTDLAGDTHVSEFAMRGGRADPATRREVLFVDQPFSNHNGGNLVFGPDGYLYIGLGDGGSGGDPMGNGQSLNTLLGKMLRIDPRPDGDAQYSVPADNPFVGRPGARPEIWAYGLRNPWRYSFDRETGDLWIGDVGQDSWEEIDILPHGTRGGQNYGWNAMEGNHPYGADLASAATPPIYENDHGDGRCALTGGYVYRGSAIQRLIGAYVFGDFCEGKLTALRLGGGAEVEAFSLGLVVPNLSSFGEDAQGELYVLSLSGEVFRLSP
jgi:glucose/arabinose dehydrogenase